MAHEVETMAYANAVPWHGLGARVDQDVSVEEMLVAAGLDWTVDKLPMAAQTPDGEWIEAPNKFALTRSSDNKIFSVTSANWNPLQNAETLGFMRDYVEAGGATLETAGSLRGGRVVWGLANLHSGFSVTKGDRVNGYLLITSPHEVGKSISIRTTTVRVVCANTMALAEQNSDVQYRQSHVSEFDFSAAREHVDNAIAGLTAEEKSAKALSKLKINLEDAIRKVIVPAAYPDLEKDELRMDGIMDHEFQPKSLQQIIDSIHNAPGAIAGNGWGILNGFTHWADHVAGNQADTRMYRAWVGDTRKTKQVVRDRLMELAA